MKCVEFSQSFHLTQAAVEVATEFDDELTGWRVDLSL
jgi:hypothetical protein